MTISKPLATASLTLGFLALLSGCTSSEDNSADPDLSTPPATSTTDTTTTTTSKNQATATFTREEIATHNSADSCYLVIDDSVYDVTDYVAKHPGGKELLKGCGIRDATALFDTKGGRGPGHSAVADQLKEVYLIGQVIR